MSALITVVAVVFVAGIGILVLAALRRRDMEVATGRLSGETVRRDRSGARRRGLAEEAEPGRAVERAAVAQRRSEPPARPKAVTPAPRPVADPELVKVSRRQFFNRSIVAITGLSVAGFGLASLAFLWPPPGVGFGFPIRVGTVGEIRSGIAAGGGFFYRPEGRMWLVEYPEVALDRARAVYSPAELAGMERGLVALWQVCPHLGCRVPECATSQWFECPCHGSFYNRVGERRAGPAPRGMDRFPMTFDNDVVTVDTGTIIPGPPLGTNTTRQEPEGPHCVAEATE